MGLFDESHPDADLDFLFAHMALFHEWTEHTFASIAYDSQTDLWVDQKATLFFNYVVNKPHLMYLLLSDDECFGFYHTNPIPHLSSHVVSLTDHPFFAFSLHRTPEPQAPHIFFFPPQQIPTLGVYTESATKLLRIERTFTLFSDLHITTQRRFLGDIPIPDKATELRRFLVFHFN